MIIQPHPVLILEPSMGVNDPCLKMPALKTFYNGQTGPLGQRIAQRKTEKCLETMCQPMKSTGTVLTLYTRLKVYCSFILSITKFFH
jgi:hypothetical protein